MTGVSTNGEGDLSATVCAIFVNIFGWLGGALIMMLGMKYYPIVFRHPVMEKRTPIEVPDEWFGWAKAAWKVKPEETFDSVGMDCGLMLEFFDFSTKLLLTISVPLFVVMSPINLWLGGGRVENGIVVTDNLSKIAIGNVRDFHPWLYWVYAFIVCAVVYVVIDFIHKAQSKFIAWRFQWLRDQPAPRCTTIMVEGIPEAYRSDDELQGFFAKAFGKDKIKEAHVVKNTPELSSLVTGQAALKFSLSKVEAEWEKAGKAEDKRPMVREMGVGAKVDAITHYKAEIEAIEPKIKEARGKVFDEAKQVGGVNTSSGFVTFNNRREKEIALQMKFSADVNEWVVTVAPDPSAINWAAFQGNENLSAGKKILGYACIVGLYIGFLPICLFVTNICRLITFPPSIQPAWVAFAPSIGLLGFLSFLPTFLNIIYQVFFSLKSTGENQHQLQISYFWFQVVFVILVTAIGTSLVTFAEQVAADPWILFSKLADQLPTATHFYMNYVALQWFSHGMYITRYSNFFKFVTFRILFGEEKAKKLAEPEDQDYYGLGGRCGRQAINLLIGVIFSTLSPMCGLLAAVNFIVSRITYGWLIVFAETRKPDLGGAFWVTLMEQLHKGLWIYCILMIGVLNFRARSWGPMIIGVIAFIYALRGYHQYKEKFQWEIQPFVEVMDKDDAKKPTKDDSKSAYMQPELKGEVEHKVGVAGEMLGLIFG